MKSSRSRPFGHVVLSLLLIASSPVCTVIGAEVGLRFDLIGLAFVIYGASQW